MSRTLEFTIYGEPVAKARPKATVIKGHARVYTPKKTENFENKVAFAFKNAYPEMDPSKKPLYIHIIATFPFPKIAFWPINKNHNGELREEWHKAYYTKKPDADNLAKSVLDGLNGIAFMDDSQVFVLQVTKQYGLKPSTKVSIEEFDDD